MEQRDDNCKCVDMLINDVEKAYKLPDMDYISLLCWLSDNKLLSKSFDLVVGEVDKQLEKDKSYLLGKPERIRWCIPYPLIFLDNAPYFSQEHLPRIIERNGVTLRGLSINLYDYLLDIKSVVHESALPHHLDTNIDAIEKKVRERYDILVHDYLEMYNIVLFSNLTQTYVKQAYFKQILYYRQYNVTLYIGNSTKG